MGKPNTIYMNKDKAYYCFGTAVNITTNETSVICSSYHGNGAENDYQIIPLVMFTSEFVEIFEIEKAAKQVQRIIGNKINKHLKSCGLNLR